ncbi:MAG: ATP-binding protein, partial [Tistlia sp.]
MAKSAAEPALVPLPAARLRRRCDPAAFGFETTNELEPLDGFLGQERALEALDFGTSIERAGFNLFVLGRPATGRHTRVRRYLVELAARRPAPADWVYVNDFDLPQRPKAMSLPSGRAAALREGMAEAIEDLSTALPAVFDSDEYRRRRRGIDEESEEAQEQAVEGLRKEAGRRGVALLHTPLGFALAPLRDGQVVKPEVFNAWPEAEQREVHRVITELQETLRGVLERMPRLDKERRKKLRELDREFAAVAVDHGLADLVQAFADLPAVGRHLEAVREDLVENAGLFTAPGVEEALQAGHAAEQGELRRYEINVLVSNGHDGGAPVVQEDHPTLPNLLGRIEHLQQMGTLVTNFTLIKAGALHRANGGYLLLDAHRLLVEPLAWPALKRALRNGRIVVESLGEYLSLVSTVSLEPEPIPFAAKVVLFGERLVYYLLSELDPDFPEIFKVAVDFGDEVAHNEDTLTAYARLIAAMVKREQLLPFDRTGVARLLEHSGRLAEDAERLSVRLGPIADLAREADHLARQEAAPAIAAAHVARAERAARRRLDRLREKHQEAMVRDILLIDSDGEKVGQVNGLSVVSLGSNAFGQPSRISARVRLGAGRVVDIERETELGGPLHSKGVLILSGLLAARYALDWPVSLAASLVFEQSYGGVEGDSASAAEGCALLSAIAELPLRQDLAITGS